MNRLWAAAGLLAVLITICTLAVISTQSITNSITQDIEQIADTSLQDDKDTALTLSRQAEEKSPCGVVYIHVSYAVGRN